MDCGHWSIDKVGEFDINDWFGFVYEVVCVEDGRSYLGKKNFFFRRTLPPLKGKKRKRKKVFESDWKEYTSSSKILNEDIDLKGKDKFEFHILWLCSGKGELSFLEVDLQHKRNVLFEKLDNGDYRYYNKTIAHKHFNGVEEQSIESRRKTSESLTKYYEKNGSRSVSEGTKEKLSKIMKIKYANGELTANLDWYSCLSPEERSIQAKKANELIPRDALVKGGQVAGKYLADNKIGMFGYTIDQKKAVCSKGGKIGGKMLWWTNGIEQTRSMESPGGEWYRGRLPHSIKTKELLSKKAKEFHKNSLRKQA